MVVAEVVVTKPSPDTPMSIRGGPVVRPIRPAMPITLRGNRNGQTSEGAAAEELRPFRAAVPVSEVGKHPQARLPSVVADPLRERSVVN